MNKKLKIKLIRIIISIIITITAVVLNNNLLYILSYIIIGYDIIKKATRNIIKGKIFDENFLMSIATIGAFIIKEQTEAVSVMIFYQIGELFQSYAVNKSRKSVAKLMNIRPDYANVYRNNEIIKVDPSEVNIEEIILIKPGEKIPLDGIIIEGKTSLNTTALTGETLPKYVEENDEVLSGCINNESIIKVKVQKKFTESTVNKILDLVENATNRKTKSENFITKFAKYYTPIVVIIALIIAIIPPLLIEGNPFEEYIYRALSFLVISCPCALVISIPLTFFGGIGAASKIGVLIKGSNYLESLSQIKTIVCDKTGTLTKGVFKVQKIEALGYSNEELLKYATYAEYYSNHPISLSLKQEYNKDINEKLITKTKEIPGKGIIATVDKKNILIGNEKLMKEHKIKYTKTTEIGTIVYIAIDNTFSGTIIISDQIKEDAYRTIKELKQNNIEKILMLTGDIDKTSKLIANQLNIDEYHAELLPQDKVKIVENLIKNKKDNTKVAFIGDGINDAPVLAISDIGISLGGLGSDAAIEASDIVIMTDEPSKIISAIKISKKTMKIVKENIIFAISVKVIILTLSAIGLTNMWLAVFADVGVSVIAILNALRILKIKER